MLLFVAACAGGDAVRTKPPPRPSAGASAEQWSHVHGLGVSADGVLYVATHHGLIRHESRKWVYASSDRNDHMGFSLHPGADVMYRSGHSRQRPSLGVERSTDGATWTHLSDVAQPPVDFHAMAVSYADARVLWGWDSAGRGTFTSADGGRTWRRCAAPGNTRGVLALAGPAAKGVVVAGTERGMWRSTDSCKTWSRVAGAGEGWVSALAAAPSDPKRMLAFTPRGMMSSVDGGIAWRPSGRGIPPAAQVVAVAIAPGDARTAFAADSSRVFATTDGGATWSVLRDAGT